LVIGVQPIRFFRGSIFGFSFSPGDILPPLTGLRIILTSLDHLIHSPPLSFAIDKGIFMLRSHVIVVIVGLEEVRGLHGSLA